MNNPIPHNNMFATPESGEELMDYIERMSGSEKAIAYTIACMTLNLAHKLVEESANESANESAGERRETA